MPSICLCRCKPAPGALEAEEAEDRRIGDRLYHLRLVRGASLEGLAAAAGIDVEELADHEAGRCPLPVSRMVRLAMALETTPEHLLRSLVDFLRS